MRASHAASFASCCAINSASVRRTGACSSSTPDIGFAPSEASGTVRNAATPRGGVMAVPARPDRFFHDRYGLSPGALDRALGTALARRADYGDLYFEVRTSEALAVGDGLVKRASKDVTQGVGVRVVAGGKTGYAYSDDVSAATTESAAQTARHIADATAGPRAVAVAGSAAPAHDLYSLPVPPLDTPLS